MRATTKVPRFASRFGWLSLLGVALACAAETGAGPDPLRPQYYQLILANNQTLPILVIEGWEGDYTALDTAVLIPYAVGRTLDQRLINDRTGRGPTGGNTRDTTVARGQFMDIRTFRHIDGLTKAYTMDWDSVLVDVEVRDTVVILKRPHPNSTLVQVDTGYFADGNLLILPTVVRYVIGQAINPVRPMTLTYRIER